MTLLKCKYFGLLSIEDIVCSKLHVSSTVFNNKTRNYLLWIYKSGAQNETGLTICHPSKLSYFLAVRCIYIVPLGNHSFIHSSMTLQSFAGLCLFFSSVNFLTQTIGLLGRVLHSSGRQVPYVGNYLISETIISFSRRALLSVINVFVIMHVFAL
jgi:hypothetical protein